MARFVIERPSAAVAGPSPTTTPPSARRGCLVAVIGAKGGCGATWLAIHLAASRAAVGRVCLLDLDFHRGDVAGALDLWDRKTVHELLDTGDPVDVLSLKANMASHPSGFDALLQPFDLANLVQPQDNELRKILGAAIGSYDRVIADCGSRVDEAMLTVATRAELVALVSQPTIPALRGALRISRLLHRLGVAEERLRLVINGTKRGHGVNLDDVPDYLHLSPVAAIPWDEETFDAMDLHGRLAWEVAKRGALARALEGLWDAVAGEGEEILLRMRRTA